MQRSLLIGFLVCSLAACDNGGGDGGESSGTDGSTSSDPSGTTDDPTPDPMTESTTDETTTDDPGSTGGSSSGEPATGSSSGGADESSSSSGEPVAFALTSPAFEEGGLFPVSMHSQGGNVHPQLDWEGAPAETQSFGVFFHDVTISFEHSAIWNVPAGVTQLPEGLSQVPMPKEVPGSVQCENWVTAVGGPSQFGYGGPGSASNFYQFTLYALDVADLSDEITQDSSLEAVRSALEAHAIETATLAGQTQAP